MAIRRERDLRRQSKHDAASMKAHQEVMGAFGRAAESNVGSNAGAVQAWQKPWTLRKPGTPDSKVEQAYHKGHISSENLADEKIANGIGINRPWHKA
jgi:hypothetical protein